MNRIGMWCIGVFFISHVHAMDKVVEDQLEQFKKSCEDSNFEQGASHYYKASELITRLLMDKSQDAGERLRLVEKFGNEVFQYNKIWDFDNRQKTLWRQAAEEWAEQIINPKKIEPENAPEVPVEQPIEQQEKASPKWCSLQ